MLRFSQSRAIGIVTIAAALMVTSGVQAQTRDTEGSLRPNVHRFRIGALEAWSLKDSEAAKPLGGRAMPWGHPEAARVLSEAGQPSDEVLLSNQPLLVRDGEALVLIDTGTGVGATPPGRLLASLALVGVRPEEITDVLISDYYDDHLGGLLTAEGALAFPNAAIHIPLGDWEAMVPYPDDADIVAAVIHNLETFEPGATLTANIRAVPLVGHTEGHSGFEIGSGPNRLLYIGDAMHSSVLSVAHPEWTNSDDFDPAAGAATRQALLDRAATENITLFSGHFPFPGLGRVRRAAQGYVWQPSAR